MRFNRNGGYLATDAQKAYLKSLLIWAEATPSAWETVKDIHIDRHHMERLTKEYASEVIGKLKAAKEAKEAERIKEIPFLHQKRGTPNPGCECWFCAKV